MGRRLALVAVLTALGAASAPAAVAHPLPGAPGCSFFPASNPWNQRVDALPVAAGSNQLVHAMGIEHLHPDFSDADADGYGIPFNVVGAGTPTSTVSFDYDDESDHLGYPIPASPKIEGGSDAHLLMVDTDACQLYELYAADHGAGGWSAGSGAHWDLASNALRPAGWTSADAAGLPIFPGLARYDEAANPAGIDHALRITVPVSQRLYVWPARHQAGSSSAPWATPMGLRVRVKASFSLAGFDPQARAILTAGKRYGFIVADNGTGGYISGAPDSGWNDDDLHALPQVPPSALEVVDTSTLPGAPAGSVRHARFDARPHRRERARFFHTQRGAVVFEAVRHEHVVRRVRATARQGMVTLTMRRVRGARYRVRVG